MKVLQLKLNLSSCFKWANFIQIPRAEVLLFKGGLRLLLKETATHFNEYEKKNSLVTKSFE